VTPDVESPQAATEARGRHRSSAESRERLLTVAAELFAEHGYEATTVREIGRRADLDPTLIARYFGSKAALYLESLRRGGPSTDSPLDLTDPARVTELLERVRRNGLTPTFYAAIRPHDDAELQAAATDMLAHRVVDPAVARAKASGREDAQLRAELMTAALAGIVVSRTAGALPKLSDAPSNDVARLVTELVRALTGSH
jgi:AcrR family transcriptional regulator